MMTQQTQEQTKTYSEDLISQSQNITVIDAPTGSGKTRWAIREMGTHPETSFVYVTPFLDEITRIQDKCYEKYGVTFKTPTYELGQKIEDFNAKIRTGVNVAVTHSTFLNATSETIEILREGEYVCIIDEALDVIQDFNEITETSENTRQQVYDTDIIDVLFKSEIIEVDQDMKVKWKKDPIINKDNKYYVVYKYASLDRLYCIDDKFLITVFPTEIFKCFSKMYVMTYMFDSSLMYYYFLKYNIQHTKNSLVDNELIPYNPQIDVDFRRESKELITIHTGRTKYKRNALSKSWYKNKGHNHPEIITLRNDMKHIFKKVLQCHCKDVMWTTYKKCISNLEISGYKIIRQLTSDEKKLSKREKQKIINQNTCFVPCNAKATNDYEDRTVLAYLINININPEFAKFFSPIVVGKNNISLGMLVQWIWRSAIRKEIPQPIDLYIPSPRMRELLETWLNV